MTAELRKIYLNPGDPGGFRSVRDLYLRAKELGLKVTVQEVKNFLASVPAYTIHARAVYRPKMREKVVSYGYCELVQCDLADMQALSRKNNGIRYLLVCVDVLSKKAYVQPLKNKLSETTAVAMETILKEMEFTPFRVQTDKGTEFYGAPFRRLMNEYKIIHFSAEGSDVKAAVAEVFIREMKKVIYKMITHRGDNRYADDLPKIVDAYNRRVHPRTGFRPNDVTLRNAPQVFAKLFPEIASGAWRIRRTAQPRYRYKVGDKVRIAMSFSKLRHGYLPRYSEEIYVVDKILGHRQPTKYKLKTLEDGEEIVGSFAAYEIIKIL